MKSSSTAPLSSLSLNGLRYLVRIGCSDEEQAVPQPIHFDIQLRFRELPEGCRTDQLADTVCYGEISRRVAALCGLGPYHLIEKLGFEVYTDLRERLPAEVDLAVTLTKEKPPIPELIGGASFRIADGDMPIRSRK